MTNGGVGSPEMKIDDGGNRGKEGFDLGSLGALGGGFWGQSVEGIEGYL